MSAFFFFDITVKNPEVYEEYKKLAKPIAEKFGGIYRVRGGALDIVQTERWSPDRVVIIEFPDKESAHAFLNCDEYASVKAIRENNADCTSFIVEAG